MVRMYPLLSRVVFTLQIKGSYNVQQKQKKYSVVVLHFQIRVVTTLEPSYNHALCCVYLSN